MRASDRHNRRVMHAPAAGRRAPTVLVAVGTALVLSVAYAPVLARLAAQWASDENYSHGFLVVPFSLYLAWQRRAQLRIADPRPSSLGVALTAAR